MILDIIALIITILTTISIACWIIWRIITLSTVGFIGKIIFIIIMTPIITGTIGIITGIITFKLSTLINKLLGIEYNYINMHEDKKNPVN